MSFVVDTFDFGKLAELPESDTIVRLMWGLNEMNQSTHFGKLVDGEFVTRPEL